MKFFFTKVYNTNKNVRKLKKVYCSFTSWFSSSKTNFNLVGPFGVRLPFLDIFDDCFHGGVIGVLGDMDVGDSSSKFNFVILFSGGSVLVLRNP